MDCVMTTKSGIKLWMNETHYYSDDIREIKKALQTDQQSKDPVAQYFACQVWDMLRRRIPSNIKL